MERHYQVQLVRDLCDSVAAEIIEAIKLGRIPAEWDGIELRWLLASKFAGAMHRAASKGITVDSEYRKRFREYVNDCLIHNL